MKYTCKMADYKTKSKCGYIADASEVQCHILIIVSMPMWVSKWGLPWEKRISHFCIDVETTFAQLSGMVCLQVYIDVLPFIQFFSKLFTEMCLRLISEKQI